MDTGKNENEHSIKAAVIDDASKNAANSKHIHFKASYFLTLLLSCLIIVVGLQAIKTTYDNDLWWLLATGREIVKHGFPRTNPWAIHDGMSIVIQQWVPSVILYGLYSLGDMPAVEVMLVLQIIVLFIILWKLCSYLSEGKNTELILLTILVAFVSLSSYFSSRPQIYTMMLYAILVLDLEKYRRTNNRRYLYVIPLITMVHVNFHASMAPLDIFILLLYLVPDIPALISRKFHQSVLFRLSSYARLPLLIASLAACAAMLINPYGIRGALYLAESFGTANYNGFIAEMGETHITTLSGFADIALIILGGIAIGRNGKKIDFPLTALFVVMAFVSMMHERNIWLVALFALPLIVTGLYGYSLPAIRLRWLHHRPVYIIFTIATLDFMLIYSYANIWPTMVDYINLYKSDSIDYPLQACDWLDAYAEEHGIEKGQIRLFNNFNNGGILEFRGYKVTMDQRPELWEPAITEQSRHYFQEFVDFMSGDLDMDDYMNEYSWDFYLVRDDGQLEDYMEQNTDKYKIVKSCNGYKIWSNVQ